MHETTTKETTKRETQPVMGSQDQTGSSALPLMKVDHLACSTFTKNQREWLDQMFQLQTRQQIGKLMTKIWGGVPIYMPDPQAGSYNLAHRMQFDSGQDAVLRQVNRGTSMFPDEKTTAEVNVMRLVAEKTAIPVAFVQCAKLTGDAKEKGAEDLDTPDLRPFILMEYLPHDRDMGKALNTPGFPDEEPQVLNPKLDPAELKRLYRLAANALLDLSRLEFDAIGSPELMDDGSSKVTSRPLTRRMNELVAMGGCRRDDLPQTVFTSAHEYLVTLAQLHMDHLAYQQNDAWSDELDCRQKYVARLLFRNMVSARERCDADRGPFTLWCDDFRPTNILLRGDDLAGVVDWEFAYAAPAAFARAPPWWLLLQRPEEWRAGWVDWKRAYETALAVFLAAMTDAEDAAIAAGRLAERHRLSRQMLQSWENGDFWVVYALQMDYDFDYVFWNGIFTRHYGPCKDFDAVWEKAWSVLTHEERREALRFASDKVSGLGG
ncbi:Protein kinase-like domain [Cordyceps militaris CM01]|uniref:Protein kinase-like domain n=1 Tax=Cordyceps militaris (strain CM01) TaxID=983644 RepID=G3JV02_CORMM|nr:Protein kinase-like domain [Cordyceps militaris CM01]EGX87678.1 Protein kinase-like domain [Cordyceps militaris CM01]